MTARRTSSVAWPDRLADYRRDDWPGEIESCGCSSCAEFPDEPDPIADELSARSRWRRARLRWLDDQGLPTGPEAMAGLAEQNELRNALMAEEIRI